MKYKQNWEETKEKFRNYWKHQNTGRPLMIVVAKKKGRRRFRRNCGPRIWRINT